MRGSPFLETQAITSEIRGTLRALNLKVRPYALRNYFVSRMESAMRDGKLTVHDKLFFEGRKTAIDLRYSHHKALGKETIEELRAAYASAEPYLGVKPSTITASMSAEERDEILTWVREEKERSAAMDAELA